ncbi:MAG: endolytic transglycosylase MltG [Elusimicrobia bacterium]|nr:endolytic transglycosylase MltG [Elusimicrobiota bacterium]
MNKKALALFLGIFAAVFLSWELPLIPRSSESVLVRISPEHKTAKDIISVFQAQGILRHPRAFRLASKVFGWDKRFKRGTYLLRRGEAWPVLAKKLLKGETFTVKVTIPEGWRAEQIADRLKAQSIINTDGFVRLVQKQTLEGFLYPSTYFFEPYSAPETIIEQMNQQFERVWKENFDGKSLPPKFTKKNVVTLASIIEMETNLSQEKPLIAGVFMNRLRQGWKLEADPTVQYALGGWKDRVLYKDLQIDSPYNTYKYRGLPPGPIGNPGQDSIAAVFDPAPTEYMYFVAKGDGSHVFFKTLQEHNRFRHLQKKARRVKVK